MGKLPKFMDPESEKIVLGCGLLREEYCRRLAELCRPDDFSDQGRRTVFRAIKEAVKEKRDLSEPWRLTEDIPDDVLVACGLSRRDITEWAGRGTSSPAFFDYAVKKLRRLHLQREAYHGVRELAGIDAAEADENTRKRIDDLLQRIARSYDALLSPTGGDGLVREIAITEDSLSKYEPPPWAIKGWLAKGDIAILGGEGHVGKSWLLLDLAFALASGSSWIGELQVERAARVLVVDEERSSALITYRMRKWAVGQNTAPRKMAELPIRWLCENALNLDDDRGWRRACAVVDEFRPEWILFDALSRFHRREESSNSEMAAFFAERVRPLSTRTGAGVVIVHHLGKPSKEKGMELKHRLRGASDLFNVCDQLWGLEKDRDSGGIALSHEKNTWGRLSAPLGVELEDVEGERGLMIRCTGRADDAGGAIYSMLQDAGFDGCWRQDLVEAVEREGVKHAGRVTTRILGEMYAAERVKKKREGRTTKYWLTFCAPPDAS